MSSKHDLKSMVDESWIMMNRSFIKVVMTWHHTWDGRGQHVRRRSCMYSMSAARLTSATHAHLDDKLTTGWKVAPWSWAPVSERAWRQVKNLRGEREHSEEKTRKGGRRYPDCSGRLARDIPKQWRLQQHQDHRDGRGDLRLVFKERLASGGCFDPNHRQPTPSVCCFFFLALVFVVFAHSRVRDVNIASAWCNC